LGALTALIHELRPDWTEPGIRGALTTMLATYEPQRVLEVAMRGARDPLIRTPGALPLAGPHWFDPGAILAAEQDLADATPARHVCQHPPGHCDHGARLGHCALCRFPDGMPFERRVQGPGADTILQARQHRPAPRPQPAAAEPVVH
jgi:hypothetical protein